MIRYLKLLSRLEQGIDRFKFSLSERFRRRPLLIVPYLSYGTKEQLFIKGRVLVDKNIRPSQPQDGLWTNFVSNYKRFSSREIMNAEVEVKLGQKLETFITNEEGFFEGHMDVELTRAYKHSFDCVLRAPDESKTFKGWAITPSLEAEFGIISDFDDTVVISEALHTRKLMQKVFFGSAHTRLAFAGVAALYQALQGEDRPLFYVSSSPWNLYDVLYDFLELNTIPLGPLLLRDWGLSQDELLPTEHSRHKLEVIEQVLRTYPNLKFLLIGDSGQDDPEIYTQIVSRYPERILAVYIRDIAYRAKDEKMQQFIREAKTHNCELVFAKDSLDIAEHAYKQGWIKQEEVEAVKKAVT